MDSSDAIIKLIVQVLNADQAKALRDELNKVAAASTQAKAAVGQLGAAAQAAEPSLADLGRLAHGTATRIDDVGPKLADATKWTNTFDTTMRRASGGGGGLATFLGQTAYLADDLQYLGEQGLRPIINNLGPMLIQFGALGATLAIVGTGVYQLAEHWRSLTSVFRSDLIANQADQVETLTKRMAELKQQSYLTGQELQELANIKIQVEGLKFEQKGFATPSERQEQVKKAFQEAVKEGGYGELQSAATQAVTSAFFRKGTIAEIEAAARSGELLGSDGKPLAVNARELRQNDAYRRQLEAEFLNQVVPVRQRDLLRRIGEGGEESALAELRNLLDASGGFDTSDIFSIRGARGQQLKGLTALFSASPEGVERLSEADAEAERLDESNRRAAEARQNRKREAARKKREEEELARQNLEEQRIKDDRLNDEARDQQRQARDADREIAEAGKALARDVAPLFGPGIEGRLIENMAAGPRGMNEEQLAADLARRVSRQLGGGPVADAAGQEIAQDAISRFTREFGGLVAHGMGRQEALQRMYAEMQLEFSKLQQQNAQLESQLNGLWRRQGAMNQFSGRPFQPHWW
jgi:hypothetical protein